MKEIKKGIKELIRESKELAKELREEKDLLIDDSLVLSLMANALEMEIEKEKIDEFKAVAIVMKHLERKITKLDAKIDRVLKKMR